MDTAEKTVQIREFVQQAHGDDWRVEIVESARIPFLQLPSWIVTSTYLGNASYIKTRVIRDLVVEKDWQFYVFDVTEIINLNDRLRVNDKIAEI